MEAWSEHVHVACTFFARLVPILYAQSVLSNKISGSEIRRKFIKSALLVGVASQTLQDGFFVTFVLQVLLYYYCRIRYPAQALRKSTAWKENGERERERERFHTMWRYFSCT